MYRRLRRIHDSGRRGIGEQRRSFEDLRAELTEEMRFQQAMFLSARDQLAAQQNEAIEGLRSDMLRIANENKQTQSPSMQVYSNMSDSAMGRQGDRGSLALQDSRTDVVVSRACAPKEVRPSSHYVPEDSSQSSHQAAVVHLAQGDNMSQHDGSRGPSRSDALVDATSVVGPRHEAVKQSSPYELSGPGISQMMTGGMPSGVPPSVYLTPVDALSQQYTTRESQMITGGMPSGIPPSVYCTPVDALSFPLVNRQLMGSQLANTNSSQYSPELFTPLDTPYYTAPSTCVRMNTPNWSTEVIPSSSQKQNDSGLGKTIADQSQGNSQSQKSPEGQAMVAQMKDNGRVTKHATFENEKRVLAYDTDATEGEEKAVTSDKKSAKKVTSTKKSSKKRRALAQNATSTDHEVDQRSPVVHGPVIKSRTVTVNRRVAIMMIRSARVRPLEGHGHESHVVSDVELRARGRRALQVVEGAQQVAPRHGSASPIVIKQNQRQALLAVPLSQTVMGRSRPVLSMC